jgi:[acyl-carrier-protein] S-malonyltransferase
MNKYAIVCSGQGFLDPGLFDFSKECINSTSIINKFSVKFNWDMFSAKTDSRFDFGLNRFSQPLTILTALANWEALKNELPTPAIIAGYSAGEVAAWGCSGALDIDLIISLSKFRCDAMDKFCPTDAGMLAVKGLKKDRLLNLLNDFDAYIAIINEADHYIVGGLNKSLISLEEFFHKSGIWSKKLIVSVPSHTPLLKMATTYLHEELSEFAANHKRSEIPIIQGLNGLITNDVGSGIESLINAVSNPVNWESCMQTLVDFGVRVVLELCPGNALSKMISEVHPLLSTRSISDFRSVQGVKSWLLRELEI